jgi:hypothetical protein
LVKFAQTLPVFSWRCKRFSYAAHVTVLWQAIITVLGLTSMTSNATFAFARPVLDAVVSDALNTYNGTVTFIGANFGAPGMLFLDGLQMGSLGSPSVDQRSISFAIEMLPAAFVGRVALPAFVRIGGLDSNVLLVPLAPPAL